MCGLLCCLAFKFGDLQGDISVFGNVVPRYGLIPGTGSCIAAKIIVQMVSVSAKTVANLFNCSHVLYCCAAWYQQVELLELIAFTFKDGNPLPQNIIDAYKPYYQEDPISYDTGLKGVIKKLFRFVNF